MGRGQDIKNDILKEIRLLNDKVTRYAQELYSKDKELERQIELIENELSQLQAEEQALKIKLRDLQFPEVEKSYANKVSNNVEDIKQLKSGTQIAKINFLNGKTYHCPFCRVELIFDDISLAYYNHQSSTEIRGFVKCNSLFCEKCRRHFLNENMRTEVKKKIGRCILKDNSIPENHVSPLTAPIAEISRTLYKEEKEKLNSEDEYFDGLSPESQLHKLGYNVSKLNKDDRWRVLVYSVLPKMSIEAVISAIEYNMRLRQGHAKFASAMSAWKYDIQRLREYQKAGVANGKGY